MKTIAFLPLLSAAFLFACNNADEVSAAGNDTGVEQAGHDHDGHDHDGHDHTGHDHDGHEHGANEAGATDGGDAQEAALFDGKKLDEADWTHYGAGVHEGEAVAVTTVLEKPEEFTDKPVRMKGPIASVCQQKGCWVRLGTEEENVFVKFKDYAYFLPLDAKGDAIVEGYVSIDMVPVDEVKHYLEDEGKHEEAAKVTEPQKAVRFMAHGAAIEK